MVTGIFLCTIRANPVRYNGGSHVRVSNGANPKKFGDAKPSGSNIGSIPIKMARLPKEEQSSHFF